MKFDYQALDGAQQVLRGSIEAESQNDAFRVLEGRGMTPLKLGVAIDETAIGRKRISPQDLIVSMFELVVLLKSGVPIAEAVSAQAKSASVPAIRQEFEGVGRALRRGDTLHGALAASALPLPEYMLQLVRAGEMTGGLAQSLSDGLEQMRYEHTVRNEFRNAMIYPGILVLSGIAAVVLIFALVVPKFSNLLDNGTDLPMLAYIVLVCGRWSHDNGMLLAFAAAVVVPAAGFGFRSARWRTSLMDFAGRMPLIGAWLEESDTARWANVLGALLANRVTLVAALELANEGVAVAQRRLRLNQVRDAVVRGERLSDSLVANEAITSSAYNLIQVGERSGQLPQVLSSVAELYEENMRNRTRQMLAVIEPMAILVIGSLIGLIIIGVILAITSASDVGL
jgi:general secretion pathway protein F